jgi:hypothetical protein
MDGQGGEGFCSFIADVFVIKKLLEGILDTDTLKIGVQKRDLCFKNDVFKKATQYHRF